MLTKQRRLPYRAAFLLSAQASVGQAQEPRGLRAESFSTQDSALVYRELRVPVRVPLLQAIAAGKPLGEIHAAGIVEIPHLGITSRPAALSPFPSDSLTLRLRLPASAGRRRAQHASLGAVIGGAVGIVTCTVISNIAKDPGTGFSTCTWKGYLGLGLGGAALGAGIGALVP